MTITPDRLDELDFPTPALPDQLLQMQQELAILMFRPGKSLATIPEPLETRLLREHIERVERQREYDLLWAEAMRQTQEINEMMRQSTFGSYGSSYCYCSPSRGMAFDHLVGTRVQADAIYRSSLAERKARSERRNWVALRAMNWTMGLTVVGSSAYAILQVFCS